MTHAPSAIPVAAAKPRPAWLFPALLTLAVALCYCMILGDPFVLDSKYHMESDALVRGTEPLSSLIHDPRPVTTLTLALNFAISGMQPWSYHLVNIGIQVLNTLLLYALIRLTILHSPLLRGSGGESADMTADMTAPIDPTTPARWGSIEHFRASEDSVAFACALIWGVHPVAVQVVTYTIQRSESLMAMFFLLCLLACHFAARAGTAPRRIAWNVAMVAAMALSVFSKEVGVTALIVAFLYEYAFFTGSLSLTVRRNAGFLGVIGLLGAALAVLVVQRYFVHSGSAGFGIKGITFWGYFLSQPAAILHYLHVSLFPATLSIDVFWQPVNGTGVIVAAFALLVGLVMAGCVLLWTRPPIGFLILTFFGILVPTSSVVPILYICVEHRVYLSLAALCVLLVVGAYRLIGRFGGQFPPGIQGRIGAGLLLATALALGVRTVVRNLDYRSSEAIWRATIATNPDNPRAYYALAGILGDQHRLEPAMELLKKTLEIQPRNAESLRAMGAMLLDSNRFDEAIPYLNTALGLKAGIEREQPLHEAILHLYLARAFDHRKEPDLARAQFDASIAAKPDFADAFAYRGDFRLARGETESGLADLEAAAKLAPGSALILNKLGVAYAKRDRVADARRVFLDAYAADPNDAETCTNLGRLLQNQRDPRCVDFYEKAYALRPDSAQSMQDMAWVLSVGPNEARHDPALALDLAIKANQRLKFSSVRAMEILVDAQLGVNHVSDAIETLKAGLQLARSQGLSAKAAQFEKAIALLNQSKPATTLP